MKPSVKVNTPSIDYAFKKYEKISKQVVFQASSLLRNEVVNSIYKSPATGRIYKRGGITHQASSAGNPPRVDTGQLVASVAVASKRNGLMAQVSANVPYAASLEFGTSKMAARPFMQPAAEAVKPKVRALIKRLIK